MSANHKITMRESELLQAVRGEGGKLTKEMGCFLLQTSPQALGRLAISLSAKGFVYRDGDGTIRSTRNHLPNRVAALRDFTLVELRHEIGRRERAVLPVDNSDPCPICGKPFKTCGHF